MKKISHVARLVRIARTMTGISFVVVILFIFIHSNTALADDSIATSMSSTASSTSSTASSTSSSTPSTAASTTPTTNPTLTFTFSIPISSPTGVDPLPVTATFSQPVTGFQASSLNVALGTVNDFTEVSPSEYTFNVAEDAPQGSVSIDSNDPNVKNAAGQSALAAPQLNVIYQSSLASGTATSTSSSGTSTSTSSTTGSSTTSTTTPPWIIFLSGPANGSTIATSTAAFTFETDASSTVSCSFGSNVTMYGCGSPQTFTGLVDGIYPFTVYATYNGVTASTTSTFTVDLEDASTTASTTDTTASSTDSTTATSTDATTTPDVVGTVYSGGFSESGSGGGTSGQYVGDTVVASGEAGDPIVTTVTTTNTPADSSGGEVSSSADLAYADDSNDIADDSSVSVTSTTTSAFITQDEDPTTTDATTSQVAAASLTGASTEVLWISFIVLVLLVLGVYWYSRRTS